jgi:hypothetical protein
MNQWKVIGLITLPVLLFGAWRVWSIYEERHAPVVVKEQPAERKITQDDTVFPRKLYIDDLKSAKALRGKTVWMQAGYTLEYYPYDGHAAELGHKLGLLPSVAALQIIDVEDQSTPPGWLSRIPRGASNFFVVFRKPGDAHAYAVPVGGVEQGEAKFYTDDLFYYDDPHQLYRYWPGSVWQAIDDHQVKLGMSELQARMSLGQIQQSGSSDYGNRTVVYTAGERKVAVTFAKDRATEIKEDKPAA